MSHITLPFRWIGTFRFACPFLGSPGSPDVRARKLNMVRRHLTQEQKRELIRQQLSETPELSDRQIAAGLGVSNSTVSVTRKEMVADNQLCDSHSSIGADGKEYPRQRAHRTAMNLQMVGNCSFPLARVVVSTKALPPTRANSTIRHHALDEAWKSSRAYRVNKCQHKPPPILTSLRLRKRDFP